MKKTIGLLFLFLGINAFAQNISGVEPAYLNQLPYYQLADHWYLLDPIEQELVEVASTELTLKLAPGADPTTAFQFLETTYGMQLLRQAETRWCDFSITNAQYLDLIAFCNQLQDLAIVEAVEVATPIKWLLSPNDSAYFDPLTQTYYQWSIPATETDKAWNKTTGSNAVVVAVIDKGVEWFHEDFAQATGTTANSSIWYNTGEDAWADPNDPTTGNGLDDDGNGFIDDWRGWNFADNNNNVNDDPLGPHGTSVAGIIAGRTNNHIGVAAIAGGWGDTAGNRVMIVKVIDDNGQHAVSTVLDDAIEYAAKNGADIINISLGIPSNFNAISAAIESVHKNYNCFIVAGSGNYQFGTDRPVVFPANHPLVFSVANSNSSDVSQQTHTGPKLDLAAPGHQLPVMDPVGHGPYVVQTGSSLSSPLVAGVAGLMLSVNPCLDNEEIGNVLKSTADKTGGFDYNHDPNRPGHSLRMGYGRVNTLKAVEVAEAMHTPGADLYMKDRDNDFGYPGTYPFGYYFDNSPDIWVREAADGYINPVHQSPEYHTQRPAWVYVKVRNKGCAASTGNERLTLYWSKASSNASWPQNWNGSDPTLGGLITDMPLPVLAAGGDTILEIRWTITPTVGEAQWGTCLLARIESAADPITVYPGMLAHDVYYNNKIAMRNLTVVDARAGKKKYVHQGITYPYGIRMLVGNAVADGPEETINIHLDVPENLSGQALTEAAEVTIRVNPPLWDLMQQFPFQNHDGVEIAGEYLLRVSSPHARLNGLVFPPGYRDMIYVGFSFLSQEMQEKNTFHYHISQHRADTGNTLLGAMHFKVTREERSPFRADAGPDHLLEQGQSVSVQAADINEAATYNWYNAKDSLIYSGKSPTLSPALSTTYRLEVIAEADLFKDYDDMRVLVNPYALKSLLPNPTSGSLTVVYDAEEATSAYLMVFPTAQPTLQHNYILDTQTGQITLSLGQLAPGNYTVLLVCDGQVAASQNFSKL